MLVGCTQSHWVVHPGHVPNSHELSSTFAVVMVAPNPPCIRSVQDPSCTQLSHRNWTPAGCCTRIHTRPIRTNRIRIEATPPINAIGKTQIHTRPVVTRCIGIVVARRLWCSLGTCTSRQLGRHWLKVAGLRVGVPKFSSRPHAVAVGVDQAVEVAIVRGLRVQQIHCQSSLKDRSCTPQCPCSHSMT